MASRCTLHLKLKVRLDWSRYGISSMKIQRTSTKVHSNTAATDRKTRAEQRCSEISREKKSMEG